MRLLLAAVLAVCAIAQETKPDVLARVAHEADLMAQRIPAGVTQETLEQRTLPRRSPQPPGLRLARTIISEYTVAPLKESSPAELVEFRQVVSVDGHAVQSTEGARHALSQGALSGGEGARKRMIEDFARHGLVDAATDCALILLEFTESGQRALKILPAGEERVGADDALVFAWGQTTPGGGELSFSGNRPDRLPLTGKLWARKSDGLPLRVSVWAVRTDAGHSVRDEATIDYAMSGQGFVAPASVLHQHLVDGQLRTENLYRYDPFRMPGEEPPRQ